MKSIKFILSVLVIGMTLFVSTPVMAQFWLSKDKKAEKEFQRELREMERQRIRDSINAAHQAQKAKSSVANEETFVEMPCYEDSRSDDKYFRELGVGEDPELSEARQQALDNAYAMMRKRLKQTCQGFVTDYNRTISGNKIGKETERMLEGEVAAKIEGILNASNNPCERRAKDRAGNIIYYYTIEILKEEASKAMADAIQENAKLKAEIDRDKFRKYVEQQMAK